MKIILALDSHFDVLYALWAEAGLKIYEREEELKRYRYMLQLNPDLCFLLINNKNEIVGSIFGTFDGRTASIHRLAIKPALQNKGWGKFLIGSLEEALKKRGIQKLVAQIHTTNLKVEPFYVKQGFKEMSYVKTMYKDI